MRAALLLISLLPFSISAQTLWPVSVGGSSITPNNLPFYSPQNLTINVGDEVRWTNTSGTHNVNGSLALFPGNPEGFSNGNPASGGWTYNKTFTIPGVYNYHCTSNGHAATQFGSITVVDPNTGLAEINNAASSVKVYPTPAGTHLNVELGTLKAQAVRIINLEGRELMGTGPAMGMLTLNVGELTPGNYFLLISSEGSGVLAKAFMKD